MWRSCGGGFQAAPGMGRARGGVAAGRVAVLIRPHRRADYRATDRAPERAATPPPHLGKPTDHEAIQSPLFDDAVDLLDSHAATMNRLPRRAGHMDLKFTLLWDSHRIAVMEVTGMKRGVGRPLAALIPGDTERSFPEHQARRQRVVCSLSDRCRMILHCAGDPPNKVVAAELGVDWRTVGKWRRRLAKDRLNGCRTGARGNSCSRASVPQQNNPKRISVPSSKGTTGVRNPSGGRNPPTTSSTPSSASVTGSTIIITHTSNPDG